MHPSRHSDSIRLTTIMLFIACSCSQIVSAQDNLSFDPYPVFIAQDEAFARCGPSGEFYRTDPLRHGQELEVYAETDDGWLGIRPPEGSFCWIPAETVEMDSAAETGTIIEDRTVAWIGTHLGRARTYRWQIQLAKGEPVTVIGKSEREGADGPQLWYRIVPPSGEYRWVHRDQVVTSSEELVALIRRQAGDQEIESFPNEQPQSTSGRATTSSTQTASTTTSSKRRSDTTTQSGEPRLADSSGPSVLQSEATVGSGLNQSWQSNEVRQSVQDSPQRTGDVAQSGNTTVTEAMKQGGLLASVEFLGRPRLLEIGGNPSAPHASETAGDANWVAGVGRSTILPSAGSVASAAPLAQPADSLGFAMTTPRSITQSGLSAQPGSVVQVSGQMPNAVANSSPTIAPAMRTLTVVSAERIAQIEAETRDADGERLSLIFSRLMAARASAAEVEPLTRAAYQLASTSTDSLVAGRARLLAERVEQYRQVAIRRDGEAVIRSTGTPTIPAGQTLPSSSVSQNSVSQAFGVGMDGGSTGVQASTQTGYLVQVYSARSNSPPFALTDNTGRTVAYVTPSPGVNLRPHLNSKVNVSGTQGFLTGLNTPHILATQAVRTPE